MAKQKRRCCLLCVLGKQKQRRLFMPPRTSFFMEKDTFYFGWLELKTDCCFGGGGGDKPYVALLHSTYIAFRVAAATGLNGLLYGHCSLPPTFSGGTWCALWSSILYRISYLHRGVRTIYPIPTEALFLTISPRAFTFWREVGKVSALLLQLNPF